MKPDPSEVKKGFDALTAALAIKPTGTGKKGVVTTADEAKAEIERRAAVKKALADYPCVWTGLRHLIAGGRKELLKSAGCEAGTTVGMITERSLEGLEVRFGYATAPIMEQLLIEQIILAWLDLDIVQRRYARETGESHTLTLGAYWDKRLSGAQHRYLRAVEALARVRKLALVTPLQINIGGQNAAVAGGV